MRTYGEGLYGQGYYDGTALAILSGGGSRYPFPTLKRLVHGGRVAWLIEVLASCAQPVARGPERAFVGIAATVATPLVVRSGPAVMMRDSVRIRLGHAVIIVPGAAVESRVTMTVELAPCDTGLTLLEVALLA